MGWGRIKMQERSGEVISGSKCKDFELEKPNFSVIRVKKKVWRQSNEKKAIESTYAPQRKQRLCKNEVGTEGLRA